MFIVSCEHGQLEIAQWIRSIKDNLDVHSNSDEAFRLSCTYGHILVAQWLWLLGDIDVHVYMDESFCWSCTNEHTELSIWLYSLSDNYRLKIDNNSIVEWKILNKKENLLDKIKTNQFDKVINILKINKVINTCNEICTICMSNDCANMVKLNCNHYYCLESITNWFAFTNFNCICPYCQKPVDWKQCKVYANN